MTYDLKAPEELVSGPSSEIIFSAGVWFLNSLRETFKVLKKTYSTGMTQDLLESLNNSGNEEFMW